MYLRPTHGTLYFAKLGNPLRDPAPALTLSTNFTVGAWSTTPGVVHYVFGYDEKVGAWSACGGESEGYTLYYGAVGAPGSGCTANFGLDLFYE
ncbi:hypothetical protein HOY80DRAFT_1007291 [Tuber brumale]|nr:hypothetical protein HOY80DRAFT_1007291 [Tuber brumale]